MTDADSLLEHLAISLPIQKYGRAVDSHSFELFDEVFTAEAILDYESAGGPKGDRDEIGAWLRESREGMVQWQHHLSPPMIERLGDSALARTDVYAPCFYAEPGGSTVAFHTGGRYHDELVKRAGGWWICARRFEATWSDGSGADQGSPGGS